jgi:hypothetical protein
MKGTREERLRRAPLLAASMRTVDLVHLLGTGACLGVALMGVVLYLVGRRTGRSRLGTRGWARPNGPGPPQAPGPS